MNEEQRTDENWIPLGRAVTKLLAPDARHAGATEIKPVRRPEVGKVLKFVKGDRSPRVGARLQECEVIDLLLRIQERLLIAQCRGYPDQRKTSLGFLDR